LEADVLDAGLQQELELLGRLVVAFVLAGALGWERESAKKAAGLRTHMLVGVASALFVSLGFAATTGFPGDPASIRLEPMAIIQAVAVGVGFLGSGIVRVEGSGNRPHGLTTAASVWACAGVGMCAGFGKYLLGAGATLLLLIALRVVAHLEERVRD
jgi:putative Mg2+ transporter-C (MgtC) family protein